jgi:hypothetical protein
MAEEFDSILVPEDIEPEVRILVEQLQEHTAERHGYDKSDIVLVKPDVEYFDTAAVAMSAALFIPTTVVASISKAWIDKYVTPVVIKRLNHSSQKFQKWLEQVLKVK